MRHVSGQPKTLTAEEQLLILRETARRPEDYRDHMIFALALGSGLRVFELVGLDVGSVKNGKGAKGVITLNPERTKGGKGGEIALPERLRRKVARFLGWKVEKGESLDPTAPLFCSRGGGPKGKQGGGRLSKAGAQAIFRAWQKRLNFDRQLGFHQLRHSFCTNLWKATHDLRLVQRAARHSSPVVTSVYVVPTIEDLLQAVQNIPC